MPATELCVIHPGALSASCWARLASHLPGGTPVKVLELETINRFWASDPSLTVDALAERLRGRLGATRAPRVLVGWGVGGVVADALAAPARRVVLLDAPAPGALNAEPTRRSACARSRCTSARARACTVRPEELTLDGIREAATAVGALRADTARRRSSAASRSTPPASCATTA